jgi:hypothetical protein
MLVFSSVQYSRFAETTDFANYSQAWWAMAHGHLDPFSTGLGVVFWRNDAEFIMWPLSLLFHLYPHPVVLLWLQDIAVGATEVVAFRWIGKIIEGERTRIPAPAAAWLAFGAALVLVVNPWVYETIAFDFHIEPIAAFFVVLVGYDLWSGRTRRLWVWVPLALFSHVLAGTYLIGVGLSGVVAGRRTRRCGAVIAAVGLGWVVLITSIGAGGGGGEFIPSAYGYLLGSHHGRAGAVDVAIGVLVHPGAALHVASTHLGVLLVFLLAMGVIGVLSPWGLGMALVVFVPNILDASSAVIRFQASFQSWPAMPFVLVGSVMVLVRWMARGGRARWWAARAAAAWAASLAAVACVLLPVMPGYWLAVDPAAATELGHVEGVIPANAEVIASAGIMGRFAQRSSAYAFESGRQDIPVTRRLVVFVLSAKEGLYDEFPHDASQTATRYVQSRLGARLLDGRADISAYAWSPPPGTTHVTLP